MDSSKFFQKKCGNECESVNLQTYARRLVMCVQVFFWQKKLWRCVRKCRCAKFRMSAHPHACKMCAMCMVWLPEFFFAKNFLDMCVKVLMCEISHVRTLARVQNVCNVHGVAVRVFFAKNFLEMCVKVRMCENSHVRTPARVRNV